MIHPGQSHLNTDQLESLILRKENALVHANHLHYSRILEARTSNITVLATNYGTCLFRLTNSLAETKIPSLLRLLQGERDTKTTFIMFLTCTFFSPSTLLWWSLTLQSMRLYYSFIFFLITISHFYYFFLTVYIILIFFYYFISRLWHVYDRSQYRHNVTNMVSRCVLLN